MPVKGKSFLRVSVWKLVWGLPARFLSLINLAVRGGIHKLGIRTWFGCLLPRSAWSSASITN